MIRIRPAIYLLLWTVSTSWALETTAPVPTLVRPGAAPFEFTIQTEPNSGMWFAASAGALEPLTGVNINPAPPVFSDDAGQVAFRFTPPAHNGPVTLDFVLDGEEDHLILAISVTEATPGVTAEAARIAVEPLVPEGARLHGPWLLERGTDIQAAGPTSVFDRGLPLALWEISWTFWIDEQPGSRFEHPTQIVIVPADSDASVPAQARAILSTWWPLIRPPSATEPQSLGGPSLETARPPRNRLIPSGEAAPEDACAVAASGGWLPGGVEDVGNEIERLTTQQSVRASRVFGLDHPAVSRESLSGLLAAAAADGCRTLFLSLSAHGSAVAGGSIVLADGKPLRYESLLEILRSFPELDLRLRVAAPGAQEAATWLNGQGWTGSSQVDSGTSGLFAPKDFFARDTRRPETAIAAEGPRRMWAPPVDIFAEGGLQRVVLRRPEAVGLGSNFIFNFDVEDEAIAGAQTGVVFLPSDQDAIRFSFGGRRQGMTHYRVIANDNTGQVYEAEGPIQVGSLQVEPRTIALTLEDRRTAVVDLRRLGFGLDRATTIEIRPRDPSIVSATDDLRLAAGETEARFDLQALSHGRTEIDLFDSASRSVYTIDARVDGRLPCPASGAAIVNYAVAPGGDPADNRARLSLLQAPVWWEIRDKVIHLSGARNEVISMAGPIDDGCRFTAAGSSGQARVGGFQGVTARATNGRLAGGRLSFTYQVGAGGELPEGQPVTYLADGETEAFQVDAVAPLFYSLTTAGGFRSSAVSLAPGWTAATDADWISILDQGAGELRFLVRPNSGFESRAAEILIGDERVVVVQASGPDILTPIVTGVGNAANFQEGVTSGGWLTVSGFGLADRTAVWFDQTAQTTGLPESLAGTEVRVNGRNAYPSFVSGRQVNALAPADSTTGRVAVEVEGPGGVSDVQFAYKRELAPELFRFTPREGRYAAAVAPDGTLIGPPRLFRTVATRPARGGDVILLFATGLGQTDPVTAVDQLVTEARPLALPPVVRIGGLPARVFFAGIVSSGLVQLNIEVPAGLEPGDRRLELFVDGRGLEDWAELTVAQ